MIRFGGRLPWSELREDERANVCYFRALRGEGPIAECADCDGAGRFGDWGDWGEVEEDGCVECLLCADGADCENCGGKRRVSIWDREVFRICSRCQGDGAVEGDGEET